MRALQARQIGTSWSEVNLGYLKHLCILSIVLCGVMPVFLVIVFL
jgi:hypothetical protein